jgi:quercetin dioxygenase-like cupin family protein
LAWIAVGYRLQSKAAFPLQRSLEDVDAIVAVDSGRRQTQEPSMSNRIAIGRMLGRTASVAGLALASAIATTSAFAGSCPTDKMKADVREPVKFAAVGVTDTTLGSIDLEKEPANIKDRQLRFRKLTIAPNGIVPWHSHGDRPALIFVAEGEIVEYASNCGAPIVHKAGEIRPETSGTSHWWKNLGNKTVVLYVGDVLHDKSDKNM